MTSMSLNLKKGDYVVYANPDNGYENDQIKAKKELELGKAYEIYDIEVSDFSSIVYLTVEGKVTGFNAALFDNSENIYSSQNDPTKIYNKLRKQLNNILKINHSNISLEHIIEASTIFNKSMDLVLYSGGLRWKFDEYLKNQENNIEFDITTPIKKLSFETLNKIYKLFNYKPFISNELFKTLLFNTSRIIKLSNKEYQSINNEKIYFLIDISSDIYDGIICHETYINNAELLGNLTLYIQCNTKKWNIDYNESTKMHEGDIILSDDTKEYFSGVKSYDVLLEIGEFILKNERNKNVKNN